MKRGPVSRPTLWAVLRLAFPLTSAATLAGLAGCRQTADCPPNKVCIRYMAWGNPEQLEVEREMIARFNRENPDVFVKFFMTPGSSYGQKSVLMLASRTAPDVMRVDHYNFPQLAKKGYFTDLGPFAKEDKDFHESDFFPTAIGECKVDGQLYGLNVLFGGPVVYYNKTLIKQAGLTDPYLLFKRGEWTWERFRDYALKIAKHDEKKRLRTAGLTIPGWPIPTVVVWGFGGDLLTPDMRHSRVDSDGTVRAYQFLADLVWKDHVAPTPAEGANSAFTFESGKVGMYFDWMGMAPRFRKEAKGFDWDVCPVPRGPSGFVDITKGNQVVVAANSQHPREAWRFIRFLSGVEAENRLYSEIRRSFPTRVAVAKSPKYLQSDLPPYQISAFVDSIEVGRALPINERWGEWTQIFSSEIDNLMSGRERDARTVLKRAKEKIDAALSEDPGF